jgi:hypothetical protein
VIEGGYRDRKLKNYELKKIRYSFLVEVKTMFFWVVMLCGLVSRYCPFGETY